MAEEEQQDVQQQGGAAGRGGSLGPVLALVAVVVVAVIAAWLVVSAFQGGEADAPARSERERVASGPIWDRWNQIEINEVLANVPGSGGRRYVKVSIQLWVDRSDFQRVSRMELQPIMREALIDRLRNYNQADLESKNAHDMLRRAFEQDLDKALRDALGVTDPERRFVQRVVLTDHLVQ